MSERREQPFGSSITADEIVDTLGFFDSWEDRYKYIIDLGKSLPGLAAEEMCETNIVRGCQSQVWMVVERDGPRLWFFADSDAFIVKGLLGLVLALFNGKTPAQIVALDVDAYFDSIGLIKHLSPTRGNGLRAMVARIRETAQALA